MNNPTQAILGSIFLIIAGGLLASFVGGAIATVFDVISVGGWVLLVVSIVAAIKARRNKAQQPPTRPPAP